MKNVTATSSRLSIFDFYLFISHILIYPAKLEDKTFLVNEYIPPWDNSVRHLMALAEFPFILKVNFKTAHPKPDRAFFG
jgi:hypothetical protein